MNWPVKEGGEEDTVGKGIELSIVVVGKIVGGGEGDVSQDVHPKL